jgi:hypothetical protein
MAGAHATTCASTPRVLQMPCTPAHMESCQHVKTLPALLLQLGLPGLEPPGGKGQQGSGGSDKSSRAHLAAATAVISGWFLSNMPPSGLLLQSLPGWARMHYMVSHCGGLVIVRVRLLLCIVVIALQRQQQQHKQPTTSTGALKHQLCALLLFTVLPHCTSYNLTGHVPHAGPQCKKLYLLGSKPRLPVACIM